MKTFWLAVILMLFGGCDRLGPGDAIYLFGALTGPDGQPAAGVTLEVERSDYRLPPEAPDFQPLAQVTTGADGHFQLELVAGDVWGPPDGSGPGNRLRLLAQQGEAGLTTSLELTGDAELPPLQLGGLQTGLSPSGELEVLLPAAPRLPETATGPNADPARPNPSPVVPVLSIRAQDQDAWLQLRPPSPLEVASLVEDFAGATVVVRGISEGHWTHDPLLASQPSWVGARFEWRTSLPTLPTGVIPFSRGASCAQADPCPWTDGALEAVEFAPDTRVLQLELLQPASPSRLVVRGLRPGDSGAERVVVEGFDGTDWRLLAEAPLVLPDPEGLSRALQWEADSAFDPVLPLFDGRYFLRLESQTSVEVSALRLTAVDFSGAPVRLGSLQEVSAFGPR